MTDLSPRMKRKIKAIWLTKDHARIDRLASRQRLARRIATLEEGGQVAVVHGFRDCDDGQRDGLVDLIPAQPMALASWAERRYGDFTEGPCWWELATPSEVADLRPTSRDLALEAFEDGHPHVIYASR